jgi:hypothetical protein
VAVELGSIQGKKAGEKKRFRAGHTKEARVENPAETSAPDPERANEMLVLRCPPRLWQASDLWVLGLQPGGRNGQIKDRPKNGPSTHRCALYQNPTRNSEATRRYAVALSARSVSPYQAGPLLS